MLRALRLIALCLPLIAAGAAVAGPARETADSTSVTTFVLRGRGYGHGVGMGQWGAFGQAKRGVSYDEILEHYYPGTALTVARAKSLRVVILETSDSVSVSSSVAFRLRDGQGKTRSLDAGSYEVSPSLVITGDGVTPAQKPKGPVALLPGGEPLSVGDKPYRGAIVVQRVGPGLQVVNEVGIDAYVRGVVTEEVPEDWPLEAIKAQAVAARSYGLSAVERGSILYADTRSQVYSGVSGESKAGDKAAAATKEEVLMFRGKVATTFFYASSGGRTADVRDVFVGGPGIPYLVSVPDPDDKQSPYHRWGPVMLTAEKVSKALGVPGATDMRAVPAGGRTREVVVSGRDGETRIPASTLRRSLELRSGWVAPGVLTLTRPVGRLVAGETSALSGVVQRVKGPVRLEQRTAGAWQTIGAVSAGPDGSFSIDVAPAVTTWYRLAAAGGVVSTPLRVPVT